MSTIHNFFMGIFKSSHNTVLRILLLLLLAMVGVNGMAQEVIYPNGNSCVNPGESVIIYFPKKNGRSLDNYFFGRSRQSRWLGLAWSVEDEYNRNDIKVDDEHLRILIPSSLESNTFYVYYGYFQGIFYRYGSSNISIRVCQDDPYVVVKEQCVCPGGLLHASVEQSDLQNHTWQLKKDDGAWTTITDYSSVNSNSISFSAPNEYFSSLSVRADNEVGSETTIYTCTPDIIGPQCAPKKSNVKLKIEHACPSLKYKLGDDVLQGSSSYDVTKYFNPSLSKTTYELKVVNGREENKIGEWTISECPVTLNCPTDFSSFPNEFITDRTDCSISATSVLNKLEEQNIRPTQNGGNNSLLSYEYWYREDDGPEKKIESTTLFYSGRRYSLRAQVYYDGYFMGVCDVPEFRVVPAMYTAKIGSFVYDKTDGPSYITSADGLINYGKSASVPCGTKLLYHAVPGDCQKFKNWRFFENYWWNGVLNEPEVYEVTVDHDVEYLAGFEPANPTITAVSEDAAKGTVSIKDQNKNMNSGNTVEYCNQQITISANPSACYVFDSWSDGSHVNPRTFSATADVNLVAYFIPKMVEVSANSNDDALGSAAITGGLTSVACNSSVEVTATPDDECSEFVRWEDGSTTNPRTVTVNGDKVFTATFRKKKVTATASSTGHGSATVSNTNPDCGTSVTFTATPDACYSFSQWEDGSKENPRTVSVSNTDVSHTASFVMVPYQISAIASGDGSVSVTQNSADVNGKDVSCGSDVTLAAIPNNGCVKFDGWNDGNKDNPRTVTADATKSFTATFSNMSDFSLSCNAEYNLLSPDGSVSIPLPTADVVVSDWAVDNGLSVSGGNVVGTLPFGTTTVIVTATVCGNSKQCPTVVNIIKSVSPCK